MKLYRRLKKVRSVEICDPHFMPMEFTTGWVEDDKMSDEDLIKHAHEQHGDNFQYILEAKFIPYEPQEPILNKIKSEIYFLQRELPTDARNMVRRTRVLDIIDKYLAESEG